MSGKGDIVQRLVKGQLTEFERKGYSEDNIQFAIEGEAPKEPRKVSFKLSSEEKLSIYQDVKSRVIHGMTPDSIGKAIVACMDEILKEKEDEAYGTTNPKLKGGFRRVE